MRHLGSVFRFGVRITSFAILMLSSYALLAYVLLPASWHQVQRRLPCSLDAITYTAEAIPADPLNVAVVGSRAQVSEAMQAAGWLPADRITFRSGLKDVHSVLFDRPYPTAPVSTHFFRNRPQDLAFERQVGNSPRQRHHVRFWRVEDSSAGNETLWIGAATFDREVGVSRFTGEVMHHIDPAVDNERDELLSDLTKARVVSRSSVVESFRAAGTGRNGGGDLYVTDGGLGIAVIGAPAEEPVYPPAREIPSRSDKS